MNDCQEVEDNGQWASVKAPECLFTEGVSSCVAVAIVADTAQRAWLIHHPTFAGHHDEANEMIEDVTSKVGNAGLRYWLLGAYPEDESARQTCDDAADGARALMERLPRAKLIGDHLGSEGNLELHFAGQRWEREITPIDQ